LSIKTLRGTMLKTLYHGTNAIFEKFDPNYLNSDCAIDQHGSGYYFYDSIEPATHHGSNIIFANCNIKKVLDEYQLDNYILTKEDIKYLILQSPELDLCLTNFGDIAFESFDKVLEDAIKLYIDMDVLHTLNVIGNDFFRGKYSHILLKEFTNLTGFNCLQKKFTEHSIWVMFDENDIDILKIVPWKNLK